MDIQKLIAFTEAAACGSFTEAAAKLKYSQSAVSRMIGDLEKEWHLILLERGKGGVRLTSDGTKVLPYVKNLIREYEKLNMEVDDISGLQSGLIRIGTFSSAAAHWLPGIIREFQKKYPNIDYELLLGDYSEIEQWILEGQVDCGFVRLPAHPDIETIFLEKDRLMAVIPEDHPLADADTFPVEALCDMPFMQMTKGSVADAQEVFDKAGITPNVHFTTWDDYAIMSMVESGLGISILPELILKRVPYHIVAKELSVPAWRSIAFGLRDAKTASLAVQRFMAYLPYR